MVSKEPEDEVLAQALKAAKEAAPTLPNCPDCKTARVDWDSEEKQWLCRSCGKHFKGR